MATVFQDSVFISGMFLLPPGFFAYRVFFAPFFVHQGGQKTPVLTV